MPTPNELRDLQNRVLKLRSAIIAKSNEAGSEAECAEMREQLENLIAERAAFEGGAA